jgi:two-component system, NtrC family, sensor kinase
LTCQAPAVARSQGMTSTEPTGAPVDALQSTDERFRLGSRLAIVLGALAAIACSWLVVGALGLATYRRGVDEAQRLSRGAADATKLGRAARDQYIQETHALLTPERGHAADRAAASGAIEAAAARLRPLATEDGGRRLRELSSCSRELVRVFDQEIAPAAAKKDEAGLHQAHHVAQALLERINSDADAVAADLERRAWAAEADAQALARRALLAVGGTTLLVLALSLLAARRLWLDAMAPLRRLREVAGRVRSGEVDARVGRLPALELDEVGGALDAMLDAMLTAEHRLAAAERLAAVGRVAAGVAHEVNNPIAVIRGYVASVLPDVSDGDLREILGIIDEEAAACQRIAEDLLAYARAPALTLSRAPAADVLEEAAARHAAAEPGARCLVERADEGELMVDRSRLRQVLANLLRNASQASPPGARIVIEGHMLAGPAGYEIRVLDEGEGIAEADLPRLFEPFFTTRGGGTGLGLAVCQGLVVAHGGSIRLEPREPRGTIAVVTLPLAPLQTRGLR